MQLVLFLKREKIKAIISSKEVLIITPAKISSCQTIFPFEMLVNGYFAKIYGNYLKYILEELNHHEMNSTSSQTTECLQFPFGFQLYCIHFGKIIKLGG